MAAFTGISIPLKVPHTSSAPVPTASVFLDVLSFLFLVEPLIGRFCLNHPKLVRFHHLVNNLSHSNQIVVTQITFA